MNGTRINDKARDIIARHPRLAGLDSVVFVRDPGGPAETVSTESAAHNALSVSTPSDGGQSMRMMS